MTIAQEVKDSSASFGCALNSADEIAVECDNSWDNLQTVFKFKDGSELIAKFPLLIVKD